MASAQLSCWCLQNSVIRRIIMSKKFSSMAKSEDDPFKIAFKYYNRRKAPPDLSMVVNFDVPQSYAESFSSFQGPMNSRTELVGYDFNLLGLSPPETWRIFSLSSVDGLYYIRNPFSAAGQRMWMRKCIEKYTLKPNKTNVDHYSATDESIWMRHKIMGSDRMDSVFLKLRWATLGYQYNWDTKIYDFENSPEFPQDLTELAKCITAVLGFKHYSPEAAIVNFYAMDSKLGGHTDHSELDHSSPLLAISLGQSAVFLFGGETKSVKPISMLLQSGDIMVMHGPCRLFYHGVPRILPTINQPWASDGVTKHENDWDLVAEYINNFRININIRQVFPR